MPTPMDSATPAPVGEYTWEPVDSQALRPGDYARGVLGDDGAADAAFEGTVERITPMGYVKLDTRAARLSPERRWFKRVPAPAVPEVSLARPKVGSRINRYYDTGPRAGTPRLNGEVTEVQDHDGYWHVNYRDGRAPCTARLYPNGHAVNVLESCPGRWEYVAPAPVVTEPAFEPVTPSQINVGDYVRGVDHGGNFWTAETVEGVVESIDREGAIDSEGGNVRIVGDYETNGHRELRDRSWTRRVSAPVAAAPEPETPVFAPPQVGERFNRTYDGDVRSTRRNCEVTHVSAIPDGSGWRVGYSWDGNRHYSLTLQLDGVIISGAARGRFERVEAPALPLLEPDGWVPVEDYSTLREGDVVRATPNGIGGRMQAQVTGSGPHWFTARTLTVIEASSNGRATDLETWGNPVGYQYGREPNTVVWRGVTPAPSPEGETATPSAPAPTREAPIPAWATSLDAARRHVHAEAYRLYRRSDNCYGGTRDFLEAADLPTEEAFPAPPDESAEIRAFLLKVREAALSTASDHGKNIRQVEGWLDRHGIVAPPPALVERTIRVVVSPDTDVTGVLSGLGWQVM